MLFLLSPAKSLDYERPLPPFAQRPPRRPAFVDQSAELIGHLRTRSPDDIAALMDLSPALAELNAARYAAWRPRFTAKNSRPAVLAFDGDVYDGFDAGSLSAEDLGWADQHIAILSGLYGVLRPMDAMQPYRLEMGTALPTGRGRNLYAYWGEVIARHLNQRIRGDASPVVVNLASQEYFKAVRVDQLRPRVIDCVFEDWKDGQYKVIGFFAKRARGMMARFAVRQRVVTPKALQAFDSAGYAFAPAASDAGRLVFRRKDAD